MTSAVAMAEIAESPWVWEPRPDVWLLIAAIGAGYYWSVTNFRRRLPSRPLPATTRQKRKFGIGLALLWAAVDWPLDRLGDEFLFSAHMGQFVLVTMVSVPLLVVGTPTWLLVELTEPFRGAVRSLTRAPVALGLFQAVVVGTHLPAVVALYVENSVVHFGLHALWVLTAALFWLPILGHRPVVNPLRPAGKVVYLIAATVVPTVPASFLTWATRPIYADYTEAPRVAGLSAVEDLQLAGLIMKLGGGFILWGFIAWVFAVWAKDEPSTTPSAPTTAEVGQG